ncbi:MAG: oligoendopeptidase F [Opitutales bacterium]
MRLLIFLSVSLCFLAANLLAQAPSTGNRDEIPEEFKWDVSHIYPDWDAWAADLARYEATLEELTALEGTLAQGPEALLRAWELRTRLGKLAYPLYTYPSLQLDTDQRQTAVRGRLQQVQALFSQAGTALAWMEPELLEIPEATVMAWIDETPALEPYRFPASESYRQAEHALDARGERLLSLFRGFSSASRDIYASLQTADMDWPTVTLGDGTEITASYPNYSRILRTASAQADRAALFEAHYGSFERYRNTFAAIYKTTLERGWAFAQARNYDSVAAYHLHDDNVPVAILENLIETVRAGTGPVKRYHRLRQAWLGLEDYHTYDGAYPLIEDDTIWSYESVVPLALESATRFGDEYVNLFEGMLDERRIDVYPNKGKRSGAYMMGIYGVGPYLLLNHNDTLRSAFTFAHEMGHALHTALSHKYQPYPTARYKIFVAETAAILNEMLFLDLLEQRADSPAERIALLDHRIQDILGTFVTQVMFADFEHQAHRRVESGQPVTADNLDAIIEDLHDTYYGDSVDRTGVYRNLWARIGHFHRSPYYVYQYATCYASSARLYEAMNTGSPGERRAAVERVLTLLKAGGSDHPMDLLKRAGADLNDPTTIQAVLDDLDRLVSELEQALDAYQEEQPNDAVAIR